MSETEDINKYIDKVGGDVKPLTIDEKIKIDQQNNNNYKIKTILSTWKEQQDADREMRKGYAIKLIWILAIQLLIINVDFFLIGLDILSYDQWVVNIFVASVFSEMAGMVLIIVKYLFVPFGKEMLDLVKKL